MQTHTSLRFQETLRGHFSAALKNHDAPALSLAKSGLDRSPLELTVTVEGGDLEGALANPGRPFRLSGTAQAASLSPAPLTAEGELILWVRDSARVDASRMTYRLNLKSDDGRNFFFDGFKEMRESLATRLWPQMTTLYFTLYEGGLAEGEVVGRGILRAAPDDFVRELASFEISGADASRRFEFAARFGRLFAGKLWDTYGGPLAPAQYLRSDAPPREKRALRTPAPEVHYFNTADEVELRLLRYRGGNKGPVILTHGIGVSSLIFRIDTVETNLVEYLAARGFDVWALDYRGSIELAAHNLQFTGDDVAAFDYPAAVEQVRALTGAPSVQMVVHCFGSVSFFMAMLRGLKGVRSAVSSQVATHLVTAPLTELKCGLYVPEALEAAGIRFLDAYINDAAAWEGKLAEVAMRLYPAPETQLCTSPVCHRILFMYSQVFQHEQLNAPTHDALGEMFGATNIRAFEHLARMVRAGHIVTANGDNSYLPHLERLAIPIAFVAGAKNRCFLPESSERTYQMLCEKNGRQLYTRTVVPEYGHADSILGKNAARDVYPAIARHLEATSTCG
ncbi:MAG: alpha/beta hydrolase [Terriglobia bacterium]